LTLIRDMQAAPSGYFPQCDEQLARGLRDLIGHSRRRLRAIDMPHYEAGLIHAPQGVSKSGGPDPGYGPLKLVMPEWPLL
jgi:hypothetical protein